jgi:hypothetical protein
VRVPGCTIPPAPHSLGTPRLYALRAEPRMRTHLLATSPAVTRGPPSLVCRMKRSSECVAAPSRMQGRRRDGSRARGHCVQSGCPRWRSGSSRGRVTVAMCPRSRGASTSRRQASLISHRGPGEPLLPADHDPALGEDLARVSRG